MGNSRHKSNFNEEGERSSVESISLSEVFEEACTIYMSYGMTYDEYWYGDAWRAKYYRDAYILKMKQRDEGLWMQGVYIYEALCDVSPILHAFSKSGTKPLPYRQHPYSYDSDIVKSKMDAEEKKQKEKQKQENERLIARIHFEKWARDTAKRFKK